MNSKKIDALFDEAMELDEFEARRVLATVFGMLLLHDQLESNIPPMELTTKIEEKILLLKKEKQQARQSSLLQNQQQR